MRRLDSVPTATVLLFSLAGCSDPPPAPTSTDAPALSAGGFAPDQVIEIGNLGGQAIPHDLNDKGIVVGTDFDGTNTRAFRWTVDEGIQPLTTPDGWSSGAVAVNRHGVAVGTAFDGTASHGVRWDAQGAMDLLPAPPAPFEWTAPMAVNDHGVVAGLLVNPAAEDPDEFTTPFRWTERGGYAIGRFPFGHELRWGGLNDRGDIVGSADGFLSEQYGVYLDQARGALLEIGSLSGTWTQATDINDHGMVVGFDWAPAEVPFVWTAKDGFSFLAEFSDAGRPNRVNDGGELVGFAIEDSGSQYGLYWNARRGVVDLAAAAGLSVGYAINNHGHVVGIRASDGAAVLWTGFAPGGDKGPALASRTGAVRVPVSDGLPCGLEGNPASRTDLLRCALWP